MPNVSSLLKSAQATQKKVRAQEDALVAFQWENSAQTYEDFATYSKYLEDRQSTATDPSDQLTYATKSRSAQRSYVSNELQRQQISIMEGRATTSDKMASVQSLYEQAVQNGDMNLAQNLYSQWDALSIKLQGETDANMKAYAAAGSKAFTDLTNSLTKGYDDVTLPTGQIVTPLAALADNFAQTGDTVANMKAAQETLEALKGAIIDQYNDATTTQDDIDKLEGKYGAGLQNIDKELTVSLGGKDLTSQDVTNFVANDQLNNPTYGLQSVHNEATGRTEYKIKENNVDNLDYTRQIDENGQEYYTPTTVRTDKPDLFFGTSDQERSLNTQITNGGAVIGGNDQAYGQQQSGKIFGGEGRSVRDDSQSIGNRLKQLGIIAKQNGTTLTIKLPGENVDREATIQPDGSIRYFGDDGQLLEIGLIKRNLGTDLLPQIAEAGQARVVSPDEASDFGTNSIFGGRLSQTSNQGQRYIDSITGQTKVNGVLPGQTPIAVGNNFSGLGAAATTGNFQGTSALLQGAQFTQKQVQQEQQRQAMLQAQQQAALQSTPVFNLNQTPVQQLASNGVLKRQLQVAAPQAQPRLYVAQPQPQQTIVGTGVARGVPTVSGVGNYSQNYNLSVR